MDAEQQRIEDDLRGQIAGDVFCNDRYVQLYASDASIYEIAPRGVVRPRSVDDVVATVKYAADQGLSLHARGSGTGLAGGALGRGLVIDFSKYMRHVVETGDDFVRIQSGVILDELNRELHRKADTSVPIPLPTRLPRLAAWWQSMRRGVICLPSAIRGGM